MDNRFKPFVVANEVMHDAKKLQDVLQEHGYLFFQGIMDMRVIQALRQDILTLCYQAGWLDATSPIESGKWSGNVGYYTDNAPEYLAVYHQVLKLPSFQQFPSHPIFMNVVEKIIDAEVFVHPRRIGRITFPASSGNTALTPPHQDWHFIRGTHQTYTIWVPLGDCSRELGGLAVLNGSHRLDYQQHVPMRGTGGAGIEVQEEGEWHTTDYHIGDFLLFHSHTIHRGLPNLSGHYLRLSTDNRYQAKHDDIDPGSLRQHYDLELE